LAIKKLQYVYSSSLRTGDAYIYRMYTYEYIYIYVLNKNFVLFSFKFLSYVKEFNVVIHNTNCRGLKIREIWRGNFAIHSIVYIAGNWNSGDKKIELR
jgi:hypothetical protein